MSPFDSALNSGRGVGFPDDPADFLLWLWRFDYHVDGLPIPPSGHAFVPRGVYGNYLEDTLNAARNAAAPGVDCEMRAIEVVGLRRIRDRYALSFRRRQPTIMLRSASGICLRPSPAKPLATSTFPATSPIRGTSRD